MRKLLKKHWIKVILTLLVLESLSCVSSTSVTKEEIVASFLQKGESTIIDCYCIGEEELKVILKEAIR